MRTLTMLFFAVALAAGLAACSDDTGEDADNGCAAISGAEGTAVPVVDKEATVTLTCLRIIDIEEGEGQEVVAGDTVTVHYTGWLENGTTFDSSVPRGEPATFALSGVIAGWTEGLQGMKPGGKRRLIIPADLGYGDQGYGDVIPPDATLTFDIELISIP